MVPPGVDGQDEQPLSTWGSGTAPSHAALSHGVVLTTVGPWTPAVLALLRHLEEVGFDGAPRVVGNGFSDDGRMSLEYLAGESPHPHAWDEAEVGQVGVLLRRLHDATASFVAPSDAAWQRTWLHDLGRGEDVVVGHGDAAPWNILGRRGTPSAFVDWELAGPVDRFDELAYAVWLNAQLHDDDVAELHDLPDPATRARHAHAVMDGYALPAGRRAALVDRMIELAVHNARSEAVDGDVHPGSTQAVDRDGYPTLWAITWRTRSASWMLRHRSLLVNAR